MSQAILETGSHPGIRSVARRELWERRSVGAGANKLLERNSVSELYSVQAVSTLRISVAAIIQPTIRVYPRPAVPAYCTRTISSRLSHALLEIHGLHASSKNRCRSAHIRLGSHALTNASVGTAKREREYIHLHNMSAAGYLKCPSIRHLCPSYTIWSAAAPPHVFQSSPR